MYVFTVARKRQPADYHSDFLHPSISPIQPLYNPYLTLYNIVAFSFFSIIPTGTSSCPSEIVLSVASVQGWILKMFLFACLPCSPDLI